MLEKAQRNERSYTDSGTISCRIYFFKAACRCKSLISVRILCPALVAIS